MKQLFFDIDSPSKIERLVHVLELILETDGVPTPKIILNEVPDSVVEELNNEEMMLMDYCPRRE